MDTQLNMLMLQLISELHTMNINLTGIKKELQSIRESELCKYSSDLENKFKE